MPPVARLPARWPWPTPSAPRSPARSRTPGASAGWCWRSRSAVRWACSSIVGLSARDVAWPGIAAAAAATGFALPQIGPLARVRWRPLTHPSSSRARSPAGWSMRPSPTRARPTRHPSSSVRPWSVPRRALIDPAAALVAAAVLLAVFGTWFALHETATFVPGTPAAIAARAARAAAEPGVRAAGAGSARDRDRLRIDPDRHHGAGRAPRAISGWPGCCRRCSAWAASSPASPLPRCRPGSAIRPGWRCSPRRSRCWRCPCSSVDSLGWLGAVLLVLGVVIAPYMITVFTLAERKVPPERSGAAMTLLSGVTGLGYAVGSTDRRASWPMHMDIRLRTRSPSWPDSGWHCSRGWPGRGSSRVSRRLRRPRRFAAPATRRPERRRTPHRVARARRWHARSGRRPGRTAARRCRPWRSAADLSRTARRTLRGCAPITSATAAAVIVEQRVAGRELRLVRTDRRARSPARGAPAATGRCSHVSGDRILERRDRLSSVSSVRTP